MGRRQTPSLDAAPYIPWITVICGGVPVPAALYVIVLPLVR